jgi:LmbE family N-acetylglucosaminyl deacetylase
MSAPVAFAVHAHPDDIEFMMAGTLLLLKEAGYAIHYMNIADGCCGGATMGREELAAVRLEEGKVAAALLGATFHPPFTHDLEVYYDREQLAKLTAVVREVQPSIMLVPSPQDYMEDHMNASSLGVTAAFCRGMPNAITVPDTSPYEGDVTVYHALPWGLCDPLRKTVRAGQYVDTGSVVETKKAALACHKSQKDWLDQSQGLDSYIQTLEDVSRQVGAQSGRFEHAEGWRRHLHAGFCAEDADPLTDALGDKVYVSDAYEDDLNDPGR